MTVKSALKNLITAMSGTPESSTIKGLLKEVVVLEGGDDTGRTIADHIQNIAVAKGWTPPNTNTTTTESSTDPGQS